MSATYTIEVFVDMGNHVNNIGTLTLEHDQVPAVGEERDAFGMRLRINDISRRTDGRPYKIHASYIGKAEPVRWS